jgi:hypothetical protein
MQAHRIALPARPATWHTFFVPALLAGAALAWFAIAVVCLVVYAREESSGPLLAPAGLVLALAGLAQARIVLTAWRQDRLGVRCLTRSVLVAGARRMVVGILLAYLAALVVGPLPYVTCAWLAGIALWQSMLMLPLAASNRVLDDWRRISQARMPRRLSWLIVAPLALLVSCELALRAYCLVAERDWFSAPPLVDADLVDESEPLEARMARLKSAPFRVAVVGDRDQASQGYLARVGQSMPGLDIVRLPVSLDESSSASAEVAEHVERCGADLVLAVLPVCQDLARPAVSANYFDWRQLELARLVVGPRQAQPAAHARAVDSFESFLGQLGPHLAACRTPIDASMHARWQRTFAALDRLLVDCREIRVPVALVIVPGEFQMNHALRETLLRRNGVAPDEFDVELPQRRLAGFASDRRLPLIDLLPHLRLCRQSVYRRHTTELNELGHSAVASAIGGWIESRYGRQFATQLSRAP